MNIFRSEDDVKAWDLYDPISETAIRPVADYFALFNSDLFTQRLSPDYLERLPSYMGQAFGDIAAMGDDPFWELPPME
jgi:hypothetical protein